MSGRTRQQCLQLLLKSTPHPAVGMGSNMFVQQQRRLYNSSLLTASHRSSQLSPALQSLFSRFLGKLRPARLHHNSPTHHTSTRGPHAQSQPSPSSQYIPGLAASTLNRGGAASTSYSTRAISNLTRHHTRHIPSTSLRSFASSALEMPAIHHLPMHARQLQWQASHQYLKQMQGRLLQALQPYWGSFNWATLVGVYRQSYAWLPSLPGFRQVHMVLLNAMNLVGNHIPQLLALSLAEVVRGSRTSKAESFEYYMEPPEHEPVLPWWKRTFLDTVNTMVNIMRTMWLLVLFGPVILTSPIALVWDIKRAEWMELLRKTLEAAGPAFIKWGQWAATRHDLFPPDFCTELEHLHTQAPNHRFKHTRKIIERAFGVRVKDMFDMIEEHPVASGSIGQIHRAVLSERGAGMTGYAPGTLVAVKVRHPGVGQAILRDFGTMVWLAHLVNDLPAIKHLRLEETLKQFAAPLQEQVDLSREASNLKRFNYNFRKTTSVRFPVPLYPLVSQDVLVETYEPGDHITTYIQSEHNPYNRRLSELGSGTMLQMMLMDNLIHSDLHPGNILVRLEPPHGMLGLIYRGLDLIRESDMVPPVTRARIDLLQQRWLQPSLVLLDVGMATELDDVDQQNMVGLFRSFAAMDGRACGHWTLAFSGHEQSCPDPEAFKVGMEEAFDKIKRTDTDGWNNSTFHNSAEALASVLELVRQYKVSLPGHICAVVVTTLVLEGWSNKLDPSHSVLTQVQTMFEQDNVAWGERISRLVDKVMDEEEHHFVLG